jgi:tRNA 2-thiouridine synthesizing protein A
LGGEPVSSRQTHATECEVVDLRGLKCPLPALFARRALERSAAGSTIEVLADDPMAIIDVPHMCRQEGYEVLLAERAGDESRFLLRHAET